MVDDVVESARTRVEYPGGSQYFDERGMFRNPVNNDAPTITDPHDLAPGSVQTIIDFDPLIVESMKKTTTPSKRSKLTKPSQEDNSKTGPSNEMIGSDSPEERAKSSTPRRESDKLTLQKGLQQPRSTVKSKAQNQSSSRTKFTEDDFESIHVEGKVPKNEPSPSSEGRANLSKPSGETDKNTTPHWLENAPWILKRAYENNRFAKENPSEWLEQHKRYPRQLLGLFAVQASAPFIGAAGGVIGGGGIFSTVVVGGCSGAAEVFIYDIVDDSTGEDYLYGIALGAGGAIVGRYILSPVINKIIKLRLDRQIKKASQQGEARAVAGFTVQESAIISEVRQILSSSEMAQIRAAHATGKSITVRIGGRLIQYEPSLPASGMTMFTGNGFLIGREALASRAELTKTILHELHRLSTSTIGKGAAASGTAVSSETQAAFQFANRVYDVVFR